MTAGLLTKKALSLTFLHGLIGHKCVWNGDGDRQCHRYVAENVADRLTEVFSADLSTS